MRAWLIRLLLALLRWLAPELAPPPAQLWAEAQRVVREVRAVRHTGHYKRVLALNAMAARYPTARRRDLALAVELAVQELS